MQHCSICGCETDNVIYECRERRINDGRVFRYLKCSKCGTLSLLDVPNNMNLYYGCDYYSHDITKSLNKYPQIAKKVLYFVIRNRITIPNFIRTDPVIGGNVLKIYKAGVSYDDDICDVGSGNGAWGARLYDLGYRNIHCVDQFVDKTPYEGITFENCEFEKVDETRKYDLITFHHSFEHMINPDVVLEKTRNLLRRKGLCIIRIPICDGWAWEKYHENWYQIDAPRHYYLYTTKAMKLLCARNGLVVQRVIHDSTYSQFANSELFEESPFISFTEAENKGRRLKMKYYLKACIANTLQRGDQAAFHIRRSN